MNSDGSWLALFLAASLRGTILMVLLMGCRLAFRPQIPARVMAMAWLVIALVWLVPFAVPTTWSPFTWSPQLPSRQAAIKPLPVPALNVATPISKPTTYLVSDTSTVPATVAGPTPQRSHKLGTGEWLTALWLGTTVLLLAFRGFAIARLNWKLLQRQTPPDARVVRALQSVARELGLQRPPEVLMSDLVSSPALCGVVRAKLLFPQKLADRLSESELRWVVLHELGHHQRGDLWTLGVLQLAAAVHWFNPLAWLAIRLGMHDAELACDEFVLRHSENAEPEEYGSVLLKVLSTQGPMDPVPSAVGIVENRRQLFRRFMMITNFRPVSLGRVVVSLTLLGGFAAVGLTQGQPAAAIGAATSTPKDAASASPTPAPIGALPGNSNQTNAEVAERRARYDAWAANAKLELRALGKVGNVPLALIEAQGEPMFVMNGSTVLGWRFPQIDLAAEQVTITDRQGQTRVLNLENPESVAFPAVNTELLLTKEALARRIERMRSGTQLPLELLQAWQKINREGKMAILLNYLRSGELVHFVPTPDGKGYSVSFDFLLQDNLAAIFRERHDRFIASLTEEQKVEFNSGLPKAIRIGELPEKKKQQMADAKQAEARRSQFLANLTPAQKALYDEWMPPAPSASSQAKFR